MNVAIHSDAPRSQWAYEKVRVFSPPGREKITLLGIAWYSNPQGFGCLANYDTIARDLGIHPRTVRRHVKALVASGQLVTWCQRFIKRQSNDFYVPIVGESIETLEVLTGISRTQLKLPLVQRDRSASIVVAEAVECPSPRDTLSLPQGQDVPQSLLNKSLTGLGSEISLRKKQKAMQIISEPRNSAHDGPVEIAPETSEFIQALLEDMRRGLGSDRTEIVQPERSKRDFFGQTREEYRLEREKAFQAFAEKAPK